MGTPWFPHLGLLHRESLTQDFSLFFWKRFELEVRSRAKCYWLQLSVFQWPQLELLIVANSLKMLVFGHKENSNEGAWVTLHSLKFLAKQFSCGGAVVSPLSWKNTSRMAACVGSCGQRWADIPALSGVLAAACVAGIQHSRVEVLGFTGHLWGIQLSTAAAGFGARGQLLAALLKQRFLRCNSLKEVTSRTAAPPKKRCVKVGWGSNSISWKCFIEEPGEPAQSLPISCLWGNLEFKKVSFCKCSEYAV